MKIRTFIFLASVFAIHAISAHSQNVLECSTNFPLSGDSLVYQRALLSSSGDAGDNVVWDFSGLSKLQEWEIIRYKGDSLGRIRMVSNTSLLDMLVSNDSLLENHDEDRLATRDYATPKLVFHYPVQYGDSIAYPFAGKELYCENSWLPITGEVVAIADGQGKLILSEGDTICNVLRMYTLISTSTSGVLGNDSANSLSLKQTIEERYDWFARGYRYPLLTMVTNTSFDDMMAVGTTHSSYVWVPELSNLTTDIVNEQRRVEDSLSEVSAHSSQDIFHYTATNNNGIMTINYSLDEEANISVLVASASGVVFHRQNTHNAAGNGYTMSIDCRSLRDGQYILYMNVNGKIYSLNFYEKN